MNALRRHAVLAWSAAIAGLVLFASLAGLFDPGVYAGETANWTLQGKGQDLGNLLAVVVLLGSAVRYHAGSLRAGLVWLGTLLYLSYAFVIYATAVHFNSLFLVYVAVLGLCAYATFFSVGRLREPDASYPDRNSGLRLPAWTLIGIGVLFALLWLSEVIPALATGQPPASLQEAGLVVNPVHVLDLSVVLPGFLLCGSAALRGRSYGLFWLGPWLTFSVLMGASILAAMLLMTATGYPAAAAPTVMVSLVVAASGVALWRFLGGVGQASITIGMMTGLRR